MYAYKITRGKVNIWAKVAGLALTKATATMAERMYTSDQSDRYATRVNDLKIPKKQNGMDSSNET